MKKRYLLFVLLLFFKFTSFSQTVLSHNIGDELINPYWGSCSEPENWAKAFTLSEFGITTDDEFVINTASIGINSSIGGERATIQYNIYSIDTDFPTSFSESNLIGSSQIEYFPYVSSLARQIVTIQFDTPVIVPANVERILVDVEKLDGPNIGSWAVFLAGTEFGNDVTWYKGCIFDEPYTSNTDLPPPRSYANLYITVNGEIQPLLPFNITSENQCLNSINQFTLSNETDIASVTWNFDDIGSGVDNTSSEILPSHQFSTSGEYNVVATVTHIDGQIHAISEVINIYDSPVAIPIVDLVQCDDDLDGFSSFNLNEVASEITANSSNETITFYETQIDAENTVNPIVNVTSYVNQIVSLDTIWARIENNNGCFEIAQVNLSVSTTQIPSTFTRDFYECDEVMDNLEGVAVFDFSSVDAELQVLFPFGQQILISYYRNEADALDESNPINDTVNYLNDGYPYSQHLYVRVESALDNDCIGLGQHITLHVNPLPLITGPVIIEECDEGNDGIHAFDTSGVETELLVGQTEPIIFSYVDEFGNIYSSPLPNPLVSSYPILNVFATMSVQYPNNPQELCSVDTTVSFAIEQGIETNPVPDFVVCDDDNDGQFAFDTSNIESTMLNDQLGLAVIYRDGDDNTLSSPLPNPFNTGTQTIVATIENPINPMCYEEITINFIVSEQPIANAVQDDFVCDDVSNDGSDIFVLSNNDSQVLNGQSNSVFEVLYFSNQIDADSNLNPLSNNYVCSSIGESIFARIQNMNSPECYDTSEFLIGVHHMPVINQPEDMIVCDDVDNDGFTIFDLSVQSNTILEGQTNTALLITYFSSLEDSENHNNPLPDLYTNINNPQTIFAKVENTLSSNCFAITSFALNIVEKPVFNMENQFAICENESIEISADSGYDEYLWSTGETSRIITVSEPGNYQVTVTNVYGDLICETIEDISVVESSIATITEIKIGDWSKSENLIIILVEGSGDYEYSIDGINYQDSNQFTNLEYSDYIVYVRDKNGCGVVTQEVYLVYYPRFFTPNNDGKNDTWQLYNSNKEPNNKIYIFDRYGKLIKQITPNSIGWDGTFKGELMSQSDYWFTIERQNGKKYTGHFTLKR